MPDTNPDLEARIERLEAVVGVSDSTALVPPTAPETPDAEGNDQPEG